MYILTSGPICKMEMTIVASSWDGGENEERQLLLGTVPG